MGYLLAFVGVIMALAASYKDDTPREPQHSFDTMSLYAEHLALYRGWVRDYAQAQTALPFGAIDDNDLSVFGEYSLPNFDHNAHYAADGNIYVWSAMGGALYAASAMDNGSASLCHVIASRQCVSGRDTIATLSASQTPAFIPMGSTVYVWQH